MNNKEIYKKTLGFSLRRVLWDILSLVLLLGCGTLGFVLGEKFAQNGMIGLLIGANERIYGTERRGNTDFLVTSGASGWAIPFKTGCISEYCVIDITAA